jgi:membrane associated rhomboid family serine protease
MHKVSRAHNPNRLNPLKYLILTTIGLSLFCALFDSLFPYLNIPRPQTFLSLSLWGIKNYFFWQFITHFFISPVSQGVNISFVLSIVFNMYFLWMVGSSVVAQRSSKDLLTLYLGGGILGGLISAIVLLNTYSLAPIAGINPALYALLTAWMMLFPEMQILLFFTIPVKIKWLILGILGVNLAMDLSHGDLLHFLPYLSSVLFGYLYAVLGWSLNSPFSQLHSFENLLIRLRNKVTINSSSYSNYQPQSRGKIYDFKTGNVLLTEEEFVDNCLSKISAHGKNSLSFMEKWKMKKISRKKKRQPQ